MIYVVVVRILVSFLAMVALLLAAWQVRRMWPMQTGMIYLRGLFLGAALYNLVTVVISTLTITGAARVQLTVYTMVYAVGNIIDALTAIRFVVYLIGLSLPIPAEPRDDC